MILPCCGRKSGSADRSGDVTQIIQRIKEPHDAPDDQSPKTARDVTVVEDQIQAFPEFTTADQAVMERRTLEEISTTRRECVRMLRAERMTLSAQLARLNQRWQWYLEHQKDCLLSQKNAEISELQATKASLLKELEEAQLAHKAVVARMELENREALVRQHKDGGVADRSMGSRPVSQTDLWGMPQTKMLDTVPSSRWTGNYRVVNRGPISQTSVAVRTSKALDQANGFRPHDSDDGLGFRNHEQDTKGYAGGLTGSVGGKRSDEYFFEFLNSSRSTVSNPKMENGGALG
jgi:hypothetical protein